MPRELTMTSFLVSFWDAKKKQPVRLEDGKEKKENI